jgi:hypothetical protein
MTGMACCRLTHPAVAGLWALALGAFVAPASARAGCGDGLMPLHPAGEVRGREPGPARGPRPAPCHGPGCSEAPPAPPLVPAPVPPRGLDDLGAPPSPVSLPTPQPSAPLDADAPALLVRPGTDVFHPPR